MWSIIMGVVSQMLVWLVIVGMPRLHVEKVTQLIFINSIITNNMIKLCMKQLVVIVQSCIL